MNNDFNDKNNINLDNSSDNLTNNTPNPTNFTPNPVVTNPIPDQSTPNPVVTNPTATDSTTPPNSNNTNNQLLSKRKKSKKVLIVILIIVILIIAGGVFAFWKLHNSNKAIPSTNYNSPSPNSSSSMSSSSSLPNHLGNLTIKYVNIDDPYILKENVTPITAAGHYLYAEGIKNNGPLIYDGKTVWQSSQDNNNDHISGNQVLSRNGLYYAYELKNSKGVQTFYVNGKQFNNIINNTTITKLLAVSNNGQSIAYLINNPNNLQDVSIYVNTTKVYSFVIPPLSNPQQNNNPAYVLPYAGFFDTASFSDNLNSFITPTEININGHVISTNIPSYQTASEGNYSGWYISGNGLNYAYYYINSNNQLIFNNNGTTTSFSNLTPNSPAGSVYSFWNSDNYPNNGPFSYINFQNNNAIIHIGSNQITASYQKWGTCRSDHCDFFVFTVSANGKNYFVGNVNPSDYPNEYYLLDGHQFKAPKYIYNARFSGSTLYIYILENNPLMVGAVIQ